MGLDKAIPKTEKEVKLIKTSLDDLPNGKPGQEFEKDRRGRAKGPGALCHPPAAYLRARRIKAPPNAGPSAVSSKVRYIAGATSVPSPP